MMSETAHFVKDVDRAEGRGVDRARAGPRCDGGVRHDRRATRRPTASACTAATSTRRAGSSTPDEFIGTEDEPDHDGLCVREQEYLLRAIEDDVDLTSHMADAVNSLRIVLAADESVRSGRTVEL